MIEGAVGFLRVLRALAVEIQSQDFTAKARSRKESSVKRAGAGVDDGGEKKALPLSMR